MPDLHYVAQDVFCRACGKPMKTDFSTSREQGADGSLCSPACVSELAWKRTLCLLGKPYRPRKAPEPA